MSDLQLALIGAGAAAVAAVWGFNRWQESRQRRAAQAAFAPTDKADVLAPVAEAPAAAERREPAFGDERREPSVAAEVTVENLPAGEAEAGEAVPVSAEQAAAPPPLPEAWADDMADCIIGLEFDVPVLASELLASQAEWADQVQRPMYWLGLDDRLRLWQPLSTGDCGRYGVVCAAMQLADRRGAASSAEVTAFLGCVQAVARHFGARGTVPAADDVLIRARAVDDACASVDMQLALNLVPANGHPFDGSALRNALEQGGFSLAEDGSFRMADDLFALTPLGGGVFDEFAENALERGLTITLDVPRVADGQAAFDRLLALVAELSEHFGCALVDAQRNALAADAIAAIRGRIADLQAQMAQRHIVPGSVRARRLFS